MTYLDGSRIYEVDIYTHINVLRGELRCPSGLRLLDILNGSGTPKGAINRDFFELTNVCEPGEGKVYQNRPRSYVRKDSVELLAISEANKGRGIGANDSWKSFPFVRKTLMSVNLQLQTYCVLGSLHLCQGQTSQALLNDEKQFVPLTEATIGTEQRIFGTWPFVILNKKHLIWLWEKQTGTVPQPASKTATTSVGASWSPPPIDIPSPSS